jgi:hypothetical protein
MTYLDDELADATDALLEGREELSLDSENRALYQVVRQLCAVIDPQTPPSAGFERRLQARLDDEWNRANAQPVLRLIERPLMRIASLAAAVVLVLGALLVLAVPDTQEQLQGAAIGFDDVAALTVLIGVAAVGAFFYWRVRR